MENDKAHIDIKTHDLNQISQMTSMMGDLEVKDKREEASSSINKAALSSEIDLVLEAPKGNPTLLALPAEIRNKIYTMLIDDVNTRPNAYNRFVGEVSLSQPALAKVNRQLRGEVLPMWYSMKSFAFCIHPWFYHSIRLGGSPRYESGCGPSQVDKAWLRFLTRFLALENGADGRDYLSYVKSLEVKLWQPDRDCLALWGFRPMPDENIVSLQFSHVDGGMYRIYRRVGRDNTNWSRRDEVRAELAKVLLRGRGSRRYPRTLDDFSARIPMEPLVHLVMLITAKCDKATRVIHVATNTFPRPHLRGTVL